MSTFKFSSALQYWNKDDEKHKAFSLALDIALMEGPLTAAKLEHIANNTWRANGAKPVPMSKRLTDEDIRSAAKRYGINYAALRAIIEVESRGTGFLADGRPAILFERHIFYYETEKPVSKTEPDISNPNPGGYSSSTGEWDRFNRAAKWDRPAAIRSASWGLGQVLGTNIASLGYPSEETFYKEMCESEAKQLEAMIKFLQVNNLIGLANNQKWASFAEAYNGPNYKINNYDVKLAAAYNKFS